MELIAKASGDDPTAVFDMFEQPEGSYGKGLRERAPALPAR